ncbi:hypothetical protein [Leucobacter luti]|uniref:hypothetical protein n=1 Tax=Leucobacter luti TaxID=340320 RepID=UPI003CFE2912
MSTQDPSASAGQGTTPDPARTPAPDPAQPQAEASPRPQYQQPLPPHHPFAADQPGLSQQEYVQQAAAQGLLPPPSSMHAQHPGGALNIFGIIALALLVLQMVFSAFSPVIYQAVMINGMVNYTALSLLVSVILGLVLVVALVLAIVGVLNRNMSRMRWTAVGSLVSATLGLVGLVLATVIPWLTMAF